MRVSLGGVGDASQLMRAMGMNNYNPQPKSGIITAGIELNAYILFEKLINRFALFRRR